MSYHKEEQDIYYIPPNFLTSGRLFGGMIRVRNAIEACVLVLLTGLPIIRLPLSLTARIILLCLIPLPLGIFAVIGFDGDSLTEFALNWIKWLFNRRISSIKYTVTYLGTPIVVEEEPSMVLPIAGLIILTAAGTLLLIALLTRKNTTVYESTGKGNEYDKCGRLLLRTRNPELRIDRLKNVPEGVIAIEVDEKAARKLFGKKINLRYFDQTFDHTVGTVNGPYWFKVDVGTAPAEENADHEEAAQ